MPVVDEDELKGIVTGRDFRYARDMEQTVAEIMTPKEKLITVKAVSYTHLTLPTISCVYV